ncbi:MAG: anthranilate phosphoribosyltransferase [Pseudomonadota bacterium]
MTTAPLTRLQPFVAKLADGGRLSRQEAAAAFEVIMTGEATDAQIAALLMGMRVRDETVDEIVGAAEIMRAKALGVTAPPDAIDTCGTGSDARGTFNISTCAAFVVAGAGVPVAKHGNKSITSRSGSSDVLTALGVTIGVAPEVVTRAIDTAGIGFMAAPAHHSATRHVMPIRAQLGIRTLLHILGPLSNPAGVKRQLLGVYDRRWLRPLAEVLGKLGSTRAWVVHGSDGLDELSTTGPSYVASLADGAVTEFEVTPEDAGVPRATLDQLAGGEPEENAAAIRDVLNGAHGAFRDIVVLNAGAALFVAGKAGDLAGGADLARAALDNGSALRALDTLVAVTNEGAAHG